MRKKLLALLLAAALALGLLAGCGGESVASALLKLLDGRYPNISIEIDPELEADLRQAIRKAEAENAGDDAAVIRAALETALGSTVTFRKLGEGQKGETTFDLVFYAGSDPGKAAQAAYSQWHPILSNVPGDGKYDTSLAMVETNSGVWMLVKATVEKAGTVDKPEPEPVTLKSLSVTGPSQTEYKENETFNPTGMTVTAHYSDGSFKPIAIQDCTLTIDGTPAASYTFQTVGSVAITVKVEYQGTEYNKLVSVWVADENGYHEEGGTYFVTGSDGLQNLYNDLQSNFTTAKITLESPVTLGASWPETITFTGELNGNGNTITMEGDRKQGLFNKINNWGTVENVRLKVGNISGTGSVGGIVGTLETGTIKGCSVTGGSISGTDDSSLVGGIVGINDGTVTACYHRGSVSTSGGLYSIAGGVVGWNVSGSVTACYHAVGEVSGGIAGGVVGGNDYGTVYDCYWSGTAVSANGSHSNHGIGIDQTGESHNDNANQVTADGKVDPTAGIVNWNTALAGLNGQSTGYTFGGEDMNNPTLTKNP